MPSVLESLTVGHLLDSKPTQGQDVRVVTVSSTQTANDAMRLLAETRVLSAPVVLDRLPDAAASRRDDDDDELETFGSQRTIGFVDIGSLLAAFLEAVKQEFGDSLSSVPNLGQELQRAWDERVGSVSVINVLATDGGLLKTKRSAAPRELSLRAVVTSTFQSPLCNTVHHRVAIHDSTGAVTTIISQSDLVRLFHSWPQQLQPHGTRTLMELNLGTQQVATVPLGTPAYQALMTLNKLGRSALGLVDGEGRLCGNFSLSDLRGIKPETMFTQLPLAVEQFIMINAMTKMGVDGFRLPLFTISSTHTLMQAIEILAENRLHRLYIIDGDGRPTGIVTLTDIIGLLLEKNDRQ